MSKYRSKVDYLQIYSGDKKGYNIGLDGSIFVKAESVPRTFQPPAIGTQGSSVGAVSADTDISGGTDTNFRIAVDGGAVVPVTLVVTGLTTGTAIAAAVESKINAALLAAGQDGRVWVEFDGAGPDVYKIHSQSTGVTSAVVVTDGLSNNVADDLKIGVGNGGTETVGVNDTDFLLYTQGGPVFSQPVDSNLHRSGRYHTGIIKKKKVAEFDITTYINMAGSAGASVDNAIQLILESALGKKTVVASTSIDFVQDLPIIYFSMVRISTIFGEYFTGAYVKGLTMSLPGDGPGTMKFTGKASTAAISGIGKVNGPVSASTDVILEAGDSKGYSALGRVMVVDVDGRTVLAGADGSLYVASFDDSLEKIVLSAAVTVADNGFIVPWHPGAVQQSGRDNVYTDLAGSFKPNSTGAAIDTTNIELDIQNDHNDLDNYFGRDANAGFVAGNRMTAKLSVTFDLSNENLGSVVRTREFGGFAPEVIVGAVGIGRYLKITAPKWIPAVPNLEVPDNGTTPITLEGNLYQSSPGARDPIKISYL